MYKMNENLTNIVEKNECEICTKKTDLKEERIYQLCINHYFDRDE